jgi:dienelactone hydrolase
VGAVAGQPRARDDRRHRRVLRVAERGHGAGHLAVPRPLAESDDFVDDDELTLLEADLRLLDKKVDFHRYAGTHHWFFEADRPAYDAAAAELAWQRTIAFLHESLASSLR